MEADTDPLIFKKHRGFFFKKKNYSQQATINHVLDDIIISMQRAARKKKIMYTTRERKNPLVGVAQFNQVLKKTLLNSVE